MTSGSLGQEVFCGRGMWDHHMIVCEINIYQVIILFVNILTMFVSKMYSKFVDIALHPKDDLSPLLNFLLI